jgi:hypothetical protein
MGKCTTYQTSAFRFAQLTQLGCAENCAHVPFYSCSRAIITEKVKNARVCESGGILFTLFPPLSSPTPIQNPPDSRLYASPRGFYSETYPTPPFPAPICTIVVPISKSSELQNLVKRHFSGFSDDLPKSAS